MNKTVIKSRKHTHKHTYERAHTGHGNRRLAVINTEIRPGKYTKHNVKYLKQIKLCNS
jgi:hypothetical protein